MRHAGSGSKVFSQVHIWLDELTWIMMKSQVSAGHHCPILAASTLKLGFKE